MVCTSLGSLLRPLFYLLDDISYPQSVHTGLFKDHVNFDTPLISVVGWPISKPFRLVVVMWCWFSLVYNGAWWVVRYLCKYFIHLGPILQQMKFPGNVRKYDIYKVTPCPSYGQRGVITACHRCFFTLQVSEGLIFLILLSPPQTVLGSDHLQQR